MQAYLKSLTAAIIAALSTLSGLAANGPIHQAGWITVALAFFVALGAVWAVPNAPVATTQAKTNTRLDQLEAQLPSVPDLTTAIAQGVVMGLQTLGHVAPDPAPEPLASTTGLITAPPLVAPAAPVSDPAVTPGMQL